MKAALLALLFSAVCLHAADYDVPIKSPDGRYVIFLRQSQEEAIFPVIMVRDTRTSREAEVFDCDSVGQGTGLHAVWSPDSRHVALTIAMGPSTQDAFVYRIADGTVREVELLAIPQALDAPRHGHRGGPHVDAWEDARTLWISDGGKNRSFRYRFTKKGKLLADSFKTLDPE